MFDPGVEIQESGHPIPNKEEPDSSKWSAAEHHSRFAQNVYI